MTDTMLPIIRQMLDAESDAVRGRILLMVPDAVLMKYREAFEAACRKAQFELGLQYIDVRRAGWHATRAADGTHKNPMFEDARAAMAAFCREHEAAG